MNNFLDNETSLGNDPIFKIGENKMFLDFLDPIDREIILYKKYEDEEISILNELGIENPYE